jgi:hypothetical protein
MLMFVSRDFGKEHTIEGLYLPVLVMMMPVITLAGAVVNVHGKRAIPA